MDLNNHMKIIDPDKDSPVDMNGVNNSTDLQEKESDKTNAEDSHKTKIPRVDIKKITKFMSQKKFRSYQNKQKAKKKAAKMGQKKKKFAW